MQSPSDSLSPSVSRASFYLRRLHSLTGALPLGGFLAVHLWTNASVLAGAPAFQHAVDQIAEIPALAYVEVALILAPLTFHAVYGVWLARNARPNVAAYTFATHWAYVMQRITGVVTFAFVVFHLWQFWAQKVFYGMHHSAFYDGLVRSMSASTWGIPWYALLYLVGVASTVFHFANGLATFCITWGLAASPRARSRVAWAATTVGTLLFLLGASSVISLATGLKPYAPLSEIAPNCK
jgi:succinate dehydrogenase/fumarate reductase cytochrome b subunit (b558 family)